MERANELITDEAIEKAFGYANFGEGHTKREILNNTMLKYACGFSTGHTAYCIARELDLINGKEKLTRLGQSYVWAVYSGGVSL